MNYSIKKIRPEDLPIETITGLKVARFGKDWVKFCEDTFEGGYQAVHKVMGCRLPATQKPKQPSPVFTTSRKKNAVERSIAILSRGVYDMGHSSRKFLCQNVQYGRFELTEKQNRWLSDLEKRFGV